MENNNFNLPPLVGLYAKRISRKGTLQLKKKRCCTESSTHVGAGAADTHHPDLLLALCSKYYPEGFHKLKKCTVLLKNE